ncbi:hypothetical protein DUNSADRAFT_8002 [Dunaliella salina]|uniref:Uncharacterized protein n=1 Tax=Dunaliella salina TaxID=3046 RepID=A0ABQ7GKG2_DUNSA|nr:hypothetical protein DUNSADRAFT_8002 [Dunaliella salina]|eukprot:KAF5835058.1 hypothetical protein DUNSADRAFT_8002 [Dunaliella salina]
MKLYFAVALLALQASLVLSRNGDYYDGYYDGYNDEDPYGGGIYDDYGYRGYDDGYGGYAGGNEAGMDYNDLYNDDYGYYQDADNEYYDYYGYYADDNYGYGDDYYYEDADVDDCSFDLVKNTPILPDNSVSCDIKIEVKQSPPGGAAAADIDGIYKLESCYNTKPLYRRENSPPGQERTLYIQIPSEGDDRSFKASDVNVTCADGSTPKEDPKPITSKVTVLSPEEIEAKYMLIYSNMKRDEEFEDVEHSLNKVNTMLVVLVVLFGLTIVLAISYFLVERRGRAWAAGSKRGAGGGLMHEPSNTGFSEASQGQNLINLEEGTSSGSGPAPAPQTQPQACQGQNLKGTTTGPPPQPPTQPQESTLQLL